MVTRTLIATSSRHTDSQTIRIDCVQGTLALSWDALLTDHIPLTSSRGMTKDLELLARTLEPRRFSCSRPFSCSCDCCALSGGSWGRWGRSRCQRWMRLGRTLTFFGVVAIHGVDVEEQVCRTSVWEIYTVQAVVEPIANVRMRHVCGSGRRAHDPVELGRRRSLVIKWKMPRKWKPFTPHSASSG